MARNGPPGRFQPPQPLNRQHASVEAHAHRTPGSTQHSLFGPLRILSQRAGQEPFWMHRMLCDVEVLQGWAVPWCPPESRPTPPETAAPTPQHKVLLVPRNVSFPPSPSLESKRRRVCFSSQQLQDSTDMLWKNERALGFTMNVKPSPGCRINKDFVSPVPYGTKIIPPPHCHFGRLGGFVVIANTLDPAPRRGARSRPPREAVPAVDPPLPKALRPHVQSVGALDRALTRLGWPSRHWGVAFWGYGHYLTHS